MINLWLLLLFALRVLFSGLELGGWSSIVLDIVLLGALFSSIDIKQILRMIKEWSFLKVRKHEGVQKRLTLDLISTGLKILSLFYIALWFSRWAVGFSDVFMNMTSAQNLTYLDAFIFCQLLAVFLDTGRFRRFLMYAKMTTGRQIVMQYGAVVVVGTVLLLMPFSLQAGQSLSLIDSLFLSVSAISVTGLSTIDIAAVLSYPGIVVLLILMQLGGLGIILVIAGFSVARFSRMSMNTILMGQEMYGSRAGDVPGFLGRVVTLTIIIETIGAALLYFCLPSDTPHRVLVAVFHSIAAFCNAGFSTFSDNLYQSSFGFFALPVICLLIILGGMGFPVLLDLISLIRHPKKGLKHLSAYTRLTLIVMGVLLILGALVFFILETVRPDKEIGMWSRIGHALFYTVSSRTAGFGVMPTESFHISSLFWLGFLMMLGANPSSTGSGIKTTTVGVLFLAVYNSILGRTQVVFAGRAIPASVVSRAITVIALYFFVAGAALTILVMTEQHVPVSALTFEVISALSTVGLSTGVTAHLTVMGKVVMMFLMLFGRIGVLAVLLASIGQTMNSKVRYPEDEFFVG